MAQKTYKEIQSDALRDTVDVLVMEGLGVVHKIQLIKDTVE